MTSEALLALAARLKKQTHPVADPEILAATWLTRLFFCKDHASTQIEHTLNLVLREFSCEFGTFRADRARSYSEAAWYWVKWYQRNCLQSLDTIVSDTYTLHELILLFGLIPLPIQEKMLSYVYSLRLDTNPTDQFPIVFFQRNETRMSS